MHSVAPYLSRANKVLPSTIPCRYISGRRYNLPSRYFHSSQVRETDHQESGEPTESTSQNAHDREPVIQGSSTRLDLKKYDEALEHGRSLLSDADEQWPGIAEWSRSPNGIPVASRERLRRAIVEYTLAVSKPSPKGYGSFRKRAMRNVREETVLTVPTLPQWFYDRNVAIHTDIPEVEKLLRLDSTFQNIGAQDYVDAVRFLKDEIPDSGPARYPIDNNLFTEIVAIARAGLKSVRSAKGEDESVSRPHLVLQSPQEGGSVFLGRVAAAVAKTLEADIISIGPSTISELVMDTGVELPARMGEQLKLLGYETYALDNDLIEEEDQDAEDEYGENGTGFKPFDGIDDNVMRRSKDNHSSSNKSSYRVNVVVPKIIGIKQPAEFLGSWLNETNAKLSKALKSEKESEDETEANLLFETFLDSVAVKESNNKSRDTSTLKDRRPLIISITDYLELQTTKSGGVLVDKLHEIVQDRRNNGQEILIIGLTSSEDLLPSTTRAGLQKLQASGGQGPYRTIITSPSSWDSLKTFEQDSKRRTKHLNVRHLQDMLRRLAWSKSILGEWCWKRRSEVKQEPFGTFFDKAMWSSDRINRLAAVALGLVTNERTQVDENLIGEALSMIAESDDKKFALLHAKEEEASEEEDSSFSSASDSQSVLAKVRKNANAHEKKILHGVIDRKDIKTTFSSVHAPESTKQALKTLTSLSLQRPEAFTYGVLANDKIPGILLYGPPGTGKTLLAKAVAGESGATVLEVSGSDIYDMYVGEGEKNVRAVFTLAQKLSPCVVFIDEADAILGSRSSQSNRTTHRELINQFLREWDGLSSKNTSAFIMVATNRPFDLDDAVLRRLPRRLLVDLPTERDREAILNIHLTDEKLDEDISLSSLAARTPFYSGSDLKNVCVAAAMQAVQEEYNAKLAFEAESKRTSTDQNSTTSKEHPDDTAATQDGEQTTYTYPPIRTLTSSHFEKALADISASISEDMSSLTAIRKFDEKYGDRRGRGKKGGLGFGMRSAADAEREKRDDGRVRREVEREREAAVVRES